MNNYSNYLDLQRDSENRHLHESNNQSAEGHRFDASNKILTAMALELNIKGIALDIGCHTGYHTEQLKEMIGDAIGIDINEKLLAVAHKYNRDYCKMGDMHNLDFADNTFDLVFAHEVLEHADNLDKALSECYRVLKPNGYLVFSVPSASRPHGYNRAYNDPHFSVFTPFEMRSKIVSTGFKVIKGQIYNIGGYNLKEDWTGQETNHTFMPHLHAVVQK